MGVFQAGFGLGWELIILFFVFVFSFFFFFFCLVWPDPGERNRPCRPYSHMAFLVMLVVVHVAG